MSELGQYLYCIIRCGEEREFAGVVGMADATPIYTVTNGELAAVVSDSPIVRYDIARKNTLTHERVIEEVMKEYTVLPVRFGTISKRKEEIKRQVLDRMGGYLHRLLNEMDGKVELSVRAFWDVDGVLRRIGQEDSDVISFRDRLARRSSVTLAERVELGKLVEAKLQARRALYADELTQALRPLASDVRAITVSADRLIYNGAFLVEKVKEKEFDRKVNELQERYDGELNLRYVGPMPPFNFVQLIIRWDEEGE